MCAEVRPGGKQVWDEGPRLWDQRGLGEKGAPRVVEVIGPRSLLCAEEANALGGLTHVAPRNGELNRGPPFAGQPQVQRLTAKANGPVRVAGGVEGGARPQKATALPADNSVASTFMRSRTAEASS